MQKNPRVNQSIHHPTSRIKSGFTIVELIIVIVVIAILATLVAVSYNGLINRAAEVSLKSDLEVAASTLERDRLRDKVYPESGDDANGGRGLTSGKGTTLGYYKTASAYCLEATSERSDVKRFHIAGKTPDKIIDGPCVMQVGVLAGDSSAGYSNGPGETARFDRPHGVAADKFGNVYVADEANGSIRKIAPNGFTTTLAGTGTRGFADGPGASAQFRNPHSVAVDDEGNVYVADRSNNRIRKVSPTGYVTTLAGTSEVGFIDGVGSNARFSNPSGITIGADGMVYVADTDNNAIRRITPDGNVSTIAGSSSPGFINGNGSSARFRKPWSITVDQTGTLFVADSDNYSVRKITASGSVTTLAGNGTRGFADGSGAAARFGAVHGIALDKGGDLFIADVGNERIRRVTSEGATTTAAGSGTAGNEIGNPSDAQFYHPHGVAVSPTGAVYVADTDGNRICRLEASDLL